MNVSAYCTYPALGTASSKPVSLATVGKLHFASNQPPVATEETTARWFPGTLAALCTLGAGIALVIPLASILGSNLGSSAILNNLRRESPLPCEEIVKNWPTPSNIQGLPEGIQLVFDGHGHPKLCPKQAREESLTAEQLSLATDPDTIPRTQFVINTK